jgi:hypothetical protein
VRLEGLGQLKKSTSSGLDPVTFQLAAEFLNQLHYRVPLKCMYKAKVQISTLKVTTFTVGE